MADQTREKNSWRYLSVSLCHDSCASLPFAFEALRPATGRPTLTDHRVGSAAGTWGVIFADPILHRGSAGTIKIPDWIATCRIWFIERRVSGTAA